VDIRRGAAQCHLEGPNPGRLLALRIAAGEEHDGLITSLRVWPLTPQALTPRLPMDFSAYPVDRPSPHASLVVFGGVPGVGKSTLADEVGRRLDISVFSMDWLLGALTPFGGRALEDPLAVGMEMLTTIALGQLAQGQSAILDCPAEDEAMRARWRSLAARFEAKHHAFVCRCSDPEVHKARLGGRTRGIAGWHDGGDWTNVSTRLEAYPPWPGATILDTATSLCDLVDGVCAVIGATP
jgi:predicted kinase